MKMSLILKTCEKRYENIERLYFLNNYKNSMRENIYIEKGEYV